MVTLATGQVDLKHVPLFLLVRDKASWTHREQWHGMKLCPFMHPRRQPRPVTLKHGVKRETTFPTRHISMTPI